MGKLRTVYAAICFLALSVSFLYVWLHLYSDLLSGGNPWKQGDWLINSENYQVRRSFSGNLIISISDWLNVSPLSVTIFIQSLILLLLAITVTVVFIKNYSNPTVLLLLVSPAFLPVFWAVEPQGSMRKEVLAYSSFSALLLLSYSKKFRLFLLMLSVALFCAAELSHEGMVFFTPVYILFVLLLMNSHSIGETAAYLSIVAVVTASVATTFIALFERSVHDYLLVCRPLLERGLHENICAGAIRWVEKDIQQNSSTIADRTSIAKLRDLGLSYALSFSSVLLFLWHTNASRRLYAIVMSLGVAFVPLYFLGVDWGRWLNFHFTSVIFLLALMLSVGKLHPTRKAKMAIVLALSFVGLFWAVGHVDPFRQHGLPQEALRALSAALSP